MTTKPRPGAPPESDVEGLGGPAVAGRPERDVEGLGPGGSVDDLDSTHRTTAAARGKAAELGLDPRPDDDGLDTDEAHRTEAYDSGLGQDPGEAGDGAATRSR